MKPWVRSAVTTILGMFVFCALVVVVLAILSSPLWAYHFNVLSFEWIVVLALTLLLIFGGGA